MDRLTGLGEISPKLASVWIYVGTAASIACTFLKGPHGLDAPPGERWVGIAALTGVFFFLFASIIVLYKPRVSHCLGIFAGLIALPWFVLTELSLGPTMNSWIALNGSDDLLPWQAEVATFATLRILSIALIVIAIACSLLRLLPTRLLWRRHPLCQRTWPAFVIGVLALIPWFIHSGIPYRTSGTEGGIGPELRIIHAEKRGLRFHETQASVFADGKVYVLRDDRRLFQYRFQALPSLGTISQLLHERVRAVAKLPEISKVDTTSGVLHSWNAEGWYVVLENSQPIAFTSEYQTAPPRQITDLFNEIQKVPSIQERPHAIKDICLGFCYSPVAALNAPRLTDK